MKRPDAVKENSESKSSASSSGGGGTNLVYHRHPSDCDDPSRQGVCPGHHPTRSRALNDDTHEWSVLLDVGLWPDDSKPTRLIVNAEQNGLLEIAESRVTSATGTAERLVDGDVTSLTLTRENAAWLAEVLPKALEYMRRKP